MMKLAYQQGCQRALMKLGMLPPGTLVFGQPRGNELTVHLVSPENLRRFRTRYPQAQRMDPRTLGLGSKQGSYRVPVTQEQTPQAVSYKATNPLTQTLSVNDAWERHDKREQEFAEPGWNY